MDKDKAIPTTQITVATFTGSPSPKYNTQANFPVNPQPQVPTAYSAPQYLGGTVNGVHFPPNATFNGAPFPGIMSLNSSAHFNRLPSFSGGFPVSSNFHTSAAYMGMSAFANMQMQPQHGELSDSILLPSVSDNTPQCF